MAKNKKTSFFGRLTSAAKMTEDKISEKDSKEQDIVDNPELWQGDQEESDGELALDVYQTATELIVQTFVAGVKPEDLEINITRDLLTLRGKRVES